MKLYGKKSPNLDLIIFKLEDSTIYPLLVPRLLPHVLVFHNGVAQKITYRMMTLLLTEDIFFCAMKYRYSNSNICCLCFDNCLNGDILCL